VVRVLILYANPVATSFGTALHQQAVKALQATGHDIDDCDLYAERFDPILSERGRLPTESSAGAGILVSGNL
jgi:putative NADPH-quinone reductase